MKKNDQSLKSLTAIAVITLSALLLLCIVNAALSGHAQKKARAQHGEMKILVLGDSIWDLVRDDTGIARLLEQELSGEVTVYNCAIKGSGTALDAPGEKEDDTEEDLGDAACLLSMLSYLKEEKGLEGDLFAPSKGGGEQELLSVQTLQANLSLLSELDAIRELERVQPEQLTHVVLAYGLNDYFGAVRRKNPEDPFDPTTYSGALCLACAYLREIAPNAKLVIVSPTYCQGYSYGQVIHESTSQDYGAGTGPDYVSSARDVALSFDGVFMDSYETLDLSIHNGAENLIDATHLTERGRKKYARKLAEEILGQS